MEDNGFKPTEFDALVCRRQHQMLKAALPYLPPSGQMAISFFTKAAELRQTMQLFQNSDNIPLGACSLDSQPASILEMLSAIRPFGSPAEQEKISAFTQVLEASSMMASGRDAVSAMDTGSGQDGGQQNGEKRRGIPLEAIKPILSQEWQSRLDTMQLLMQVLQA